MKEAITIADTLRQLVVNSGSKEVTPELQLLLATAIASAIDVPAEKGGDAFGAWKTCGYDYARKLVNTVNELFIVDVDNVLDSAKEIFMAKYKLVHGGFTNTKVITAFAQAAVSDAGLKNAESFATVPMNDLTSLTQVIRNCKDNQND